MLTKAGSLGVACVEGNLLKGRNFWQEKVPQNCTWSWRKILELRDIARNFIKYKVGDGMNISFGCIGVVTSKIIE
jgi:hypothetical protein